jgi:hypothetical protein
MCTRPVLHLCVHIQVMFSAGEVVMPACGHEANRPSSMWITPKPFNVAGTRGKKLVRDAVARRRVVSST